MILIYLPNLKNTKFSCSVVNGLHKIIITVQTNINKGKGLKVGQVAIFRVQYRFHDCESPHSPGNKNTALQIQKPDFISVPDTERLSLTKHNHASKRFCMYQ